MRKGIEDSDNSLVNKEYKVSLVQEAEATCKRRFVIFGKELEFKKDINLI